jgi:hypothetical protein
LNENEEEYSPPPQSYISTTANGDGLEFDKRLGSIFEEIEKIKSFKLAENAKLIGPLHFMKEDDELSAEDI